MAALLALSTTVRNAMLNAIRDAIDAGATGGLLKIYDGTRPATGGSVTTLLATLTFSVTSAPNASGGVLTFSAITSGTAVATGTATWGRITDDAATFVADVNVAAASADFILNTASIVTGATVSCSAGTITAGNA